MISKKTKYSFVSLILFAMISMFVLVSYASAYAYYNGGYPSASYELDFGYSRYNSTWTDRIAAAVTSWNLTSTPVAINNNGNSSNKVYVASYSDTWYGSYTPSTNWLGNVTSFNIKLNSRTIGNDATNWNNYVESVMVHELGHSLSLGDLNSGTSIMNENRNRNTMYKPQTDDINGVNAYY